MPYFYDNENNEYVDLDQIQRRYHDKFFDEHSKRGYSNWYGRDFKAEAVKKIDDLFDLNDFEICNPINKGTNFFDWDLLKNETEKLQAEYKNKTKYELFLYAAYKQVEGKIKTFEEYFNDDPHPHFCDWEAPLEDRARCSYDDYVRTTLAFEQAREHMEPSCDDHPLEKGAWYSGIDPEGELWFATKDGYAFDDGWDKEGRRIDLVLKPRRQISDEDLDAMDKAAMSINDWKC